MTPEKRKPDTPEQIAKRKRDREINDNKKILAMPEGRRHFRRLLAIARIYIDGYVAGDSGYETTYNCGRRSVGLWALSEMMEADPNAFMQMQREHASEAKREEIEEKEKEEKRDILKIDD